MLKINDPFLNSLRQMSASEPRVKWYLAAIPLLSAINYPEDIPLIWTSLISHELESASHEEKLQTVRSIREALVKSCGIIGAPRVTKTLK